MMYVHVQGSTWATNEQKYYKKKIENHQNIWQYIISFHNKCSKNVFGGGGGEAVSNSYVQ